MKSIKIYAYGVLGLLTAGLGLSCTKSFDEKIAQNKNFNGSTIAQVYNAIVNSSNNLLVVDANNVSASTLSYAGVFPGTGYGFNITPGIRDFNVTGVAPQVPLTFAENMLAGKHHTIFLYDTTTSPKQKTVIDNIVIPADTTSRIRFANFAYSPYVQPAIDIFSRRRNANVATNLKVTDVTDYIVYPSGITDTLVVRLTGSTTDLLNLTPPTPAPGNQLVPVQSIFTLTQKRNYTLVFRGSWSIIGTTTANVRGLSLFANY